MRLPLRHMLNDYVDVVLLSSGPLAAMAGPQLARHFDLPLALAEAALSKGSGPVATQLPRKTAIAALGLMATLGVRLVVVPVGEDVAPDLFDLSLRLTDLRAATCVEQKLRDLGLRIALDDFGTGYSSLSYLRSFPFDKLKIDQSFVREMGTRPDCRAIVHSVAALASSLGIITTAEGVESKEQLEEIRLAGCAEAQGYYFDRPLPVEDLHRWFQPRANDSKDRHMYLEPNIHV